MYDIEFPSTNTLNNIESELFAVELISIDHLDQNSFLKNESKETVNKTMLSKKRKLKENNIIIDLKRKKLHLLSF
jgi:hypothetical protein